MPKINQKEYEILKGLDDKGEWIARNYNGALITYTDKPTKNPNLYWDSFGERMDDRLFQFIQWGDEEPYEIAELIEEYEEYLRTPVAPKMSESEEKEVKKDIEWLKSAIQQNLDFYNDNDEEWQMAKVRAYAKSLDLINQLDEPKVLSQEWISDNAVVGQYPDGMGYVVPAYKLQNLLVPKRELPVIPKFVADYIREGKDLGCDLGTAMTVETEVLKDIRDYIKNNEETFARAWLDGYTVEEEQKYIVSDNSSVPLLIKNDDGKVMSYDSQVAYNNSNGTIELTEQEIKDYDERYWPFAVKVEELEE